MRNRFLGLFIIIGLVFVLTSRAFAAEFTWNPSALNGTWSTGTNWTPTGPPTNSSDTDVNIRNLNRMDIGGDFSIGNLNWAASGTLVLEQHLTVETLTQDSQQYSTINLGNNLLTVRATANSNFYGLIAGGGTLTIDQDVVGADNTFTFEGTSSLRGRIQNVAMNVFDSKVKFGTAGDPYHMFSGGSLNINSSVLDAYNIIENTDLTVNSGTANFYATSILRNVDLTVASGSVTEGNVYHNGFAEYVDIIIGNANFVSDNSASTLENCTLTTTHAGAYARFNGEVKNLDYTLAMGRVDYNADSVVTNSNINITGGTVKLLGNLSLTSSIDMQGGLLIIDAANENTPTEHLGRVDNILHINLGTNSPKAYVLGEIISTPVTITSGELVFGKLPADTIVDYDADRYTSSLFQGSTLSIEGGSVTNFGRFDGTAGSTVINIRNGATLTLDSATVGSDEFTSSMNNCFVTIFNGQLTNYGAITGGNISIESGGTLLLGHRTGANAATSSLTSSELIIRGGSVTSSGSISNSIINANAGTLTLQVPDGAGTGIFSGGRLNVSGATVHNFGTIANQAQIAINSGTFNLDQIGSSGYTQTSQVNDSTIEVIGGTLNNFGQIIDTSLTQFFGTSNLGSASQTTSSSVFTRGSLSVEGGQLTNYGLIDDAELAVISQGEVVNQGSIKNSTITVTGTMTNSGTIEREVPGGGDPADYSSILTINAGTFTNQQGAGSIVDTVINVTEQQAGLVNENVIANSTITIAGVMQNKAELTDSTLSINGGTVFHQPNADEVMSGGEISLNSGYFYKLGPVQGLTATVGSGAANPGVFIFSEASGTGPAADTNFIINATNAGVVEMQAQGDIKQFAFSAGSKYATKLSKVGGNILVAEKLQATDASSINNAQVTLLRGDGVNEPIADQTVELMNATAGLTASNVTLDSSMFNEFLFEHTFELDDTNTMLNLVITRKNTYQGMADSTNNKRVARALDYDRDNSGTSPELDELMAELDMTADNVQFNIALRNLQPGQFTSSRYLTHRASISANHNLSQYRNLRRRALTDSMSKLTIKPTELGLASANSPTARAIMQVLPETPAQRKDREPGMGNLVNVFARATTGYTRVGGTTDRIGLRSSSIGTLFGFDVRVHENMIVGFTGSYDYNDIDFSAGRGFGRINSYRFGPYAMLYADKWFFETEFTIGLHDNRFTRDVTVGIVNYKPRSKYDSVDFTFNIGGGYDFELLGINLTPRANVQYQFYHAGAYNEKGGSGANLNVSRYETSSLSSRIGVDLWKRFDFSEQHDLAVQSMTPFFSVGWRREWLTPDTLTSQFSGGEASFSINNDLYSKNGIYLGLGSSFDFSDQLKLDLKYETDLGDRQNISQNAYINLRYEF